MHRRILGERSDAAQSRILENSVVLAERFSVNPQIIEGLSARDRVAEVATMLQREAVADLLQEVVSAPPVTTDDAKKIIADLKLDEATTADELISYLHQKLIDTEALRNEQSQKIALLTSERDALKSQVEELTKPKAEVPLAGPAKTEIGPAIVPASPAVKAK